MACCGDDTREELIGVERQDGWPIDEDPVSAAELCYSIPVTRRESVWELVVSPTLETLLHAAQSLEYLSLELCVYAEEGHFRPLMRCKPEER